MNMTVTGYNCDKPEDRQMFISFLMLKLSAKNNDHMCCKRTALAY